jgi:hypothetical protein
MTVNNKLGRIWLDASMVSFKVLSHYLFGGIEENQKDFTKSVSGFSSLLPIS